jgi:hypothetical protein
MLLCLKFILQTDHKCVLDSCRYLQSRGFDVTYLPVEKNGLINLSQLQVCSPPLTWVHWGRFMVMHPCMPVDDHAVDRFFGLPCCRRQFGPTLRWCQ